MCIEQCEHAGKWVHVLFHGDWLPARVTEHQHLSEARQRSGCMVRFKDGMYIKVLPAEWKPIVKAAG